MNSAPKFLFFKQTAPLRSTFSELCLDVAGEESAIVFSDLEHDQVANVRFVKGPAYSRESAAKRFKTWLSYLFGATVLAFRTPGTPKLFIVAQPPFMPLLGLLQKKLMGRKYVLWIDDVWPDVIVRQGLRRDTSFIIRIWRCFNRVTYRNADHIFTLGPFMRECVKQYVPEKIPISIVPTWVDTEAIRPIPKAQNPFAVRYGQVQKITVLYSGNLGVTHDIRSILRAARMLRHRRDLHFMIIGAGPQWESIEQSIEDNNDSNVTLLPLQPSDVFPYSLATADIALSSLERGIEGISMPSKTYYSLAAGSAMIGICMGESDLAYVIKSNECGDVVSPGNPEGLARLIENMASSPTELGRFRENARHAAEQLYSRKNNTAKLRTLIAGETSERATPDGTERKENSVGI